VLDGSIRKIRGRGSLRRAGSRAAIIAPAPCMKRWKKKKIYMRADRSRVLPATICNCMRDPNQDTYGSYHDRSNDH
jgi:hypothetical protein